MRITPITTHNPNTGIPSHTSKRIKHLFVAFFVSLILLACLIIFILHTIVAWHLAYPYVPELSSNPYHAKQLPYENFIYSSSSGASTVEAWYIPAYSTTIGKPSSKTVVLSHGYGANREESWVPMYDIAELLNQLNYNVIMFDYGYASKNNLYPATWGAEEQHQLKATIQLAKQKGAEQIIVWGFSMGAGTALQAALTDPDIDALILDSLFVPSPDTLYTNLQQIVDVPKYPTTWIMTKVLPIWTQHYFDSEPSQNILQHQYDIPLLIIHGNMDDKADFNIAKQIFMQQTDERSQFWLIENGFHELLFRKNPNEYMSYVTQFLAKL